jgi:hypothetical protein
MPSTTPSTRLYLHAGVGRYTEVDRQTKSEDCLVEPGEAKITRTCQQGIRPEDGFLLMPVCMQSVGAGDGRRKSKGDQQKRNRFHFLHNSTGIV